MPQALFGCEETLALDECAFNLAVVNRRVDTASNVHLDIRT